jgi:hypothetical protein
MCISRPDVSNRLSGLGCVQRLGEQVGALAAAAVVPADADVAVPVRVQQRLQLGTVFCVQYLGR